MNWYWPCIFRNIIFMHSKKFHHYFFLFKVHAYKHGITGFLLFNFTRRGWQNLPATYSFQRNTRIHHMHWLSLIHMNFLKYIKYIYRTVLKMHLVSHFETSVWLLFFLYLVFVSGCFFYCFLKAFFAPVVSFINPQFLYM